MTLEEAIKVLPTIKEYFSWWNIDRGEINLDGIFTIDELRALITIYDNQDKIASKQ